MGGDHKCPLCEATFTRPQHVGRHLRAHTGDRPYECKECPLRFARSDLLSRHVNKTHREPTDAEKAAKEAKKVRRKSVGTVDGQPILKQKDKARAASFSLASANPRSLLSPQSSSSAAIPSPLMSVTPSDQAAGQLPNFPALSSAYPPAGPSNFATLAPSTSALPPAMFQNTVQPQFLPPYRPGLGTVPNGYSGPTSMDAPPIVSAPMTLSSSSEMGLSASEMARNPSYGSWSSVVQPSFDYTHKKRACDQCSHSKVRCDFAEPCQRCTTKNFVCSYIKPQKSRSLIQPIGSIPTHLTGQPILSQLNTSLSPQSSFSSPYSGPSPTDQMASHLPPYPSNAAYLAQQHEIQRRRSSEIQQPQFYPERTSPMPILPYTSSPSSTQSTWQTPEYPVQGFAGGMTYGTPPQMYPPSALYDPNQYQPMQQGTWSHLSQSFVAPIPQRASSLVSTIHIDQAGQSPLTLAPTPGLTSHSNSPSGPSEPQEHQHLEPGLGGRNYGIPAKSPYASDASVFPPLHINPQPDNSVFHPGSYPDSIPFYPLASHQYASIPIPEPAVDQMYQFRTNAPPRVFDEDDSTASHVGSAASGSVPSFLDVEEAAFQQTLEQRRRASMNGGVWATAFNNMSLQDPAGNYLLPQQAQSISGSSTLSTTVTLPTHAQTSMLSQSADPSVGPPSMSDVKDLWKMFMTDPMTGPTPSKEKSNYLDYAGAQPVMTPRPGMGPRTLSKSNSMPDLKSPQINGPGFFSNFYPNQPNRVGGGDNGGKTPMGGIAPQGSKDENGGEAQLREWQEGIKHRQHSFAMSMQHPGPTRKQMVKSGSMSIPTLPPTHYTDLAQPSSHLPELANRPMASVFQRNQNLTLNQTLAPERAPSFGIYSGQVFDGGVTPTAATFPRHTPVFSTTLPSTSPTQNVFRHPADYVPSAKSKPTSASARPGNKRLASQILVGADGKRSSFSVSDEEEEDAEGENVLDQGNGIQDRGEAIKGFSNVDAS